jgi:hypothetical protein
MVVFLGIDPDTFLGVNCFEGVSGSSKEMGKTLSNLLNAFTRAAQFEGLSGEASYRVQKVAECVNENETQVKRI